MQVIECGGPGGGSDGHWRDNRVRYFFGHPSEAVLAGVLAGLISWILGTVVLAGIGQASLFIELHRLPELFCGFARQPGESPTLYPTACSPQAWAAGSGFLLLQACLGLQIDAPRRLVSFVRPVLPPFLERVEIRNLSVGTARLDLALDRHENEVAVRVTRRTGEVEVVLTI